MDEKKWKYPISRVLALAIDCTDMDGLRRAIGVWQVRTFVCKLEQWRYEGVFRQRRDIKCC